MPKALDPKLKDLAKALYFQGFTVPQVAEKMGLKPKTVKTWSLRETWGLTRNTAKAQLEAVSKPCLAVEVANDLNAKSKAAKEALADVITAQVETLKAEPGRSLSQLRNTPEGQGSAAVAKTVAETAAKVFGWDAQSARSAVNINVLGHVNIDTDTEACS